MSKPLIQIDDEVREMTDEEYAAFLEAQQNEPPLGVTNETPNSNS